MKHAKKLASLLLALAMVVSMSAAVFAASGTNGNNGKITVENAVKGQTYNLYQLFTLASYDTDPNNDGNTSDGVYSYTISTGSDWYGFVAGDGAGAAYVTLTKHDDATYYVTWNSDKSDASDIAAFSQAALKYAGDNTIAPTATTVAGDDPVVFSGLNLGYYLMDTTLGTLLTMDTTNPEVIVREKNEIPSVTKEVQEDSTGNWGSENTAQIGDTVNYRTTVTAKPGAQKYVLHDDLSEGLTLDSNPKFFKVYAGSVADANLVSASNYTLTTNPTDGCDFEISFSETYLNNITTETTLIVTYSATLNENAVIKDNGLNDANTNKTRLGYGDNNFTEWSDTKTYTLKFDIVKTDSSKKLLTGAKFELYDAENGGNKINLVAVDSDNDGTTDYYRVATAAEAGAAVIEAGKATVVGLDANTSYWLEETEAPKGFNKLAKREKVAIENDNLVTAMTGDTWADGDGGVRIENNTGTELPSTGGMGTTIFYVLGSILLIGAAVLLIVKKRMGAEK